MFESNLLSSTQGKKQRINSFCFCINLLYFQFILGVKQTPCVLFYTIPVLGQKASVMVDMVGHYIKLLDDRSGLWQEISHWTRTTLYYLHWGNLLRKTNIFISRIEPTGQSRKRRFRSSSTPRIGVAIEIKEPREGS